MIEFILARYNYWIVIILMMTGLYIVFSRGNLVKTIVGLNIFQTSVFIFYITVGKVAGATAPILLTEHQKKKSYGDDHSDGYSSSGTESHTESAGEAHADGSHIDKGDAYNAGVHDAHTAPHAEPSHSAQAAGYESGGHYGGHGDAVTPAFDVSTYSNPLPHVLILTAIVVGVATTAVGLAIAIRIREAYGTIEEDQLERMDNEAATGSPTGEGGTL